MIRKGVQVDILKCLTEGKPVIIEGVGVIPDMYIGCDEPAMAESEETLRFIMSYVNNEIKLKKKERRDRNLFNSDEQAKRKWKIIHPKQNHLEDESE